MSKSQDTQYNFEALHELHPDTQEKLVRFIRPIIQDIETQNNIYNKDIDEVDIWDSVEVQQAFRELFVAINENECELPIDHEAIIEENEDRMAEYGYSQLEIRSATARYKRMVS